MTVLERRFDDRGARSERAIVRVLSCQISPDKGNYIATCETRDVSVSGMSVVMPVTLPENTEVEIWLEIKGFQRKFLLSGLVRWCHREQDQWLCGVELQIEPALDINDWQALFLS